MMFKSDLIRFNEFCVLSSHHTGIITGPFVLLERDTFARIVNNNFALRHVLKRLFAKLKHNKIVPIFYFHRYKSQIPTSNVLVVVLV